MILVTGATGNVGSPLVGELLSRGQRVRVLVREPRKVAHLAGRVDAVAGDLDRPDSLRAAMAGVQAVYLVAFHLQQVANVVEAAERAGVRRLVRQSTIEAGEIPPLGPGKWHREQEALIERSCLAWSHLRPSMMMVNTAGWWSRTIRAEGKVFFPGGEGGLSPVDPRDIASVAAAVLTQPGHEGRAYEITGPEVLTIGQMVETLAKVLARPIEYVDIPEAAAARWMMEQGMTAELASALAETFRALRSSRFAYVADTVETLTGRPALTYGSWCRENLRTFLNGER